MSTAETRGFEAEVSQVLALVTHSLYSHKEIFLRELISNASDACDKLRFEALGDPALLDGNPALTIDIRVDKSARTVSVSDSGIGMRRDEVIEHIGTIARSGTKRFLEALSADARASSALIGQFGVGFYSSFIVAEEVIIETRHAGATAAEAVRWTSSGGADYTIETIAREARGTTVTLRLKAGEDEFLDGWRLRSLVQKYSDHIGFPIRLVETGGDPSADNADDDAAPINQASALWTRPKGELTDVDYQGFYKSLAHDMNDALAWTHNRVEGNQVFTLLLYVPGAAPFDFWLGGRDERRGLKLYVRRVFIMDAADALLPAYLRFVRGVVDSDDLPLNVSREILQDNRLVAQIRAATVKRALDLLERLATDEPTRYQTFWKAFGVVIKEGIADDYANRERIARLLRFASTKGQGSAEETSLDAYIARMKDGQDAIYYVTADSHAAAAASPHLERLRALGIEVLLLGHRVDEWLVGHLTEYAGKKLRSVAKGALDLGKLVGADAEASAATEAAAPDALALAARIKTLLGDTVSEVRISRRLIDSPACLVLGENDMALHMQRLLNQAGHEVPESRGALEINAHHPLVARLAASGDDDARALSIWLYEQSVLAEGGTLAEPMDAIRRLNALLARAPGEGASASAAG